MPKVTYIDYSGIQRQVDAKVGDTLMEVALENDVPGIDADCSGACACSTCHIYISEDWISILGKPDEIEADMLSVAEEVRDNSRLSCQLEVTDEMDGLVVSTPESQY